MRAIAARMLREQLRRGVLEDQLGLVLDRDQFVEPPFAHERTLVQNADAIADLLHLPEQMRAEQDGDAALFEIENQIANLARAGRIDAGGRFIEHQQPRLLHERLREPDALEHSFRIAADAPVRRVFEPDELQQFLRRDRAVSLREARRVFRKTCSVSSPVRNL